MPTTIKTHYIGFYEKGSTIAIPVDFIKNTGPGIAVGIIADVAYPAGLTYNSSSLSKGVYSDITKEWTIASLIKGESVNGIFYFDVVDDCVDTFQITIDVSSVTTCTSCLSNPSICINTYGVSCCNLSGCKGLKQDVINSNTVISSQYELVYIDGSLNTVQITLPAPNAVYNSTTKRGHVFTFKVADFTFGSTIVTPSGVIVDNTDVAGAIATYTNSAVGESIQMVSDGTNYNIIG